MARFALIFGCVVLLGVVLFGVVRFSPNELNEVLRREFASNADYLGRERALHLLDEAIGGSAKPAAPPRAAEAAHPATPTELDKALGRAGGSLMPNRSLADFGDSVSALGRLAIFRTSCLYASLPILMLFAFAAMVDGMVRRRVKTLEFSAHDPEVVALSMLGMLLLLFVMVCMVIWPYPLPALLLPSMLLPVAYSLNRAAANYRS